MLKVIRSWFRPPPVITVVVQPLTGDQVRDAIRSNANAIAEVVVAEVRKGGPFRESLVRGR